MRFIACLLYIITSITLHQVAINVKFGIKNLGLEKAYQETCDVSYEALSDDQAFDKIVDIIFYSGFKAQTVSSRLDVIRDCFPSYKLVAKFAEDDIEKIISNKEMIKNRRKIDAAINAAMRIQNYCNHFEKDA